MNWRYLFLLLPFPAGLAAQPAGDVVFAGRIVDKDQRGIGGARVVLVGVSEARTDDDGMFRVSIPAGMAEVTVEVERYDVVYPRSGRAPVPRSAGTPVVIEVKKAEAGEQDKLIRQLQENVRKLEGDKRFNEQEIKRLSQNIQDTIRVFQRLLDRNGNRSATLLDSLQREVQTLMAARESTLLAQKKQALYDGITQSLLNFLDKAKNLRDALARIDDVFLSEQARAGFEQQVTAYNQARDSLYNHHKGYAESVRLFWGEGEAATRMETVSDLALVQIHEGIILPLNNSVIGPVRDAATGQASRMSANRKARKGAQKAMEQLAFPLRNLELKINVLSNALSH